MSLEFHALVPTGRQSITYQAFGVGLAVHCRVTCLFPAVAVNPDGGAGRPPSEVTWTRVDGGPSPPLFAAATWNSYTWVWTSAGDPHDLFSPANQRLNGAVGLGLAVTSRRYTQ